ncbi:hypothetical protein TELCIR_11341, partial [Teladorsagia circumcincta]
MLIKWLAGKVVKFRRCASTAAKLELMSVEISGERQVATRAARSSSAERPAANTNILHGPSGLAIITVPNTAVLHGPSGESIISTATATTPHVSTPHVAAQTPQRRATETHPERHTETHPEPQTITRPANTDVLYGPSGPTIVQTPNTAVLHGPSGTEIISTGATTTPEVAAKTVQTRVTETQERETVLRPANTDVLHGPSGPTILVTPNTAVLHGPSGAAIISTQATATSEAATKTMQTRVTEIQGVATGPANTDVLHGPSGPTVLVTPNTAVLHGTSGTAIISTAGTAVTPTAALAPSSERVSTAVPIGSPCGRVSRNIPQGPSAIPTDLLMLHKVQSKAPTHIRGRSVHKVRRVSRSRSRGKAPTDVKTAKSTSRGDVSTPAARRRSRSIPSVWTAKSAPGTHSSSATPPPPDRSGRSDINAPADTRVRETQEVVTGPANTDVLHGPSGPTVLVTPNTAVLHGTSGTSIISTAGTAVTPTAALAPSSERVSTAVPIGSPCGRVSHNIPQGPSAIPTDLLMLHKVQSKAPTHIRGRSVHKVRRVSRSRSRGKAPTDVKTAKSTSRGDVSTPAARRRSRSIPPVWTAKSAPGTHSTSATPPPPDRSGRSDINAPADVSTAKSTRGVSTSRRRSRSIPSVRTARSVPRTRSSSATPPPPDRSARSDIKAPADVSTAKSVTKREASTSTARRRSRSIPSVWTAKSAPKTRSSTASRTPPPALSRQSKLETAKVERSTDRSRSVEVPGDANTSKSVSVPDISASSARSKRKSRATDVNTARSNSIP